MELNSDKPGLFSTAPPCKSEEMGWFVMLAIYGQELKIKRVLDSLGVENFIPMQLIQKDSNIELPQKSLIKNLVFVHAEKSNLQQIKSKYQYFQYYTYVVDKRRVPMIVPEDQMRNFIAAMSRYNEEIVYHESSFENIYSGDKVKVIGGKFDGVEGEFVKLSGRRTRSFIVKINGLFTLELKGVLLKNCTAIKN